MSPVWTASEPIFEGHPENVSVILCEIAKALLDQKKLFISTRLEKLAGGHAQLLLEGFVECRFRVKAVLKGHL